MKTKLPPKPFYYIRHGETDWNFQGRSMGQQDIPLNAKGFKQAEKARSLLKNCKTPILTICHSPLTRARQTAEIINKILNCSLVEIEDLKECCWGEFEGNLKVEGEYFTRWKQGETPNGAETYPSFFKRAIHGINQALAYPNPLIVSHGGIYWAVLKAIEQEQNYRASIPNCQPVFHQPPERHDEFWRITFLDQAYEPEHLNK